MGVASDTLARISREQWDDYKQRFIPLENDLIAAYNNPQDRADRMNEAVGLANKAFDTSQGVAERSMSRYGLSMAGQNGYERESGMNRTAAVVDAMNTNRAHMNERDKMLLTGGLTSRGV